MPAIVPKPLDLVSHCSLFRETFVLADNGRYRVDTAKHNRTYIAEIEKTVTKACVIKYVGKNGVKVPDDRRSLADCCNYAVDYAQKWIEDSGKDHVVFVLEGDNVEETCPFIMAQIQHIKKLKEGKKYKVTVLIVKGVQENGYSKAFVDGWQKELSEMNALAETYFAVAGTTKAEDHKKADISYSLAGLVVNVGSNYKHEGFMYKLNGEGQFEIGPEGNKVKTVGYQDLCSLRESPHLEEVTPLLDGVPLSPGLTVFKKSDTDEITADKVEMADPPEAGSGCRCC